MKDTFVQSEMLAFLDLVNGFRNWVQEDLFITAVFVVAVMAFIAYMSTKNIPKALMFLVGGLIFAGLISGPGQSLLQKSSEETVDGINKSRTGPVGVDENTKDE